LDAELSSLPANSRRFEVPTIPCLTVYDVTPEQRRREDHGIHDHQTPMLMFVRDATRALGCSEALLRKWIGQGRFVAVRFGRDFLFDPTLTTNKRVKYRRIFSQMMDGVRPPMIFGSSGAICSMRVRFVTLVAAFYITSSVRGDGPRTPPPPRCAGPGSRRSRSASSPSR
jgi:hypothetical protein